MAVALHATLGNKQEREKEDDHDHSDGECRSPAAISTAILMSKPLYFRVATHKRGLSLSVCSLPRFRFIVRIIFGAFARSGDLFPHFDTLRVNDHEPLPPLDP